MSDEDPVITFVCGFCRHAIRVPAAAEGRAGRCPQCQHVVRVPMMADPVSLPFVIDHDSSTSRRRLNGMLPGVAASGLLHLVLLSVLAIMVVHSKELGRSIIVTLLQDAEGSAVDLTTMPLEIAAPLPAAVDGDAEDAGEDYSSVEIPTFSRAAQPAVTKTGGRLAQAPQAPVDSGSIDHQARFSPAVVNRLEQQPAAKRGDFEIALIWEGISDLDLHVKYQSSSGKMVRFINFSNKGTPQTGFLDVDQNYRPPFVSDPVEHIRWNTRNLPPGTYTITVSGFRLRTPLGPIPDELPFMLEVKTLDGVRSFSGFVGDGKFVDVDTLAIGGAEVMNPEMMDQESVPAQSLPSKTIAAASEELASAKQMYHSEDRIRRRIGIGKLKNIVQKYPDTEAAREAQRLLRH